MPQRAKISKIETVREDGYRLILFRSQCVYKKFRAKITYLNFLLELFVRIQVAKQYCLFPSSFVVYANFLRENTMKKFFAVLLLIVCMTVPAGCSLKKEYELAGKERVEAFKKEAEAWRSGRYLLTNLDTGEMNQAFSFMYNRDGAQSYLYEVVNGGNYYAEYSDGSLLYVVDGGNTAVISEGGEGYVKYSESEPHPYSKGELLFYANLFVKSSAEVPVEGGTSYVYYYNVDKINETLGTSLSEFYTSYVFDGEGGFLYFEQHSTNDEGSYAYRIECIDMDGLTEIENPALGE